MLRGNLSSMRPVGLYNNKEDEEETDLRNLYVGLALRFLT